LKVKKAKRSQNCQLNCDNAKAIGATCGFALRYFVLEASATGDASDDRLRQM
jgi:hypothetical protein